MAGWQICRKSGSIASIIVRILGSGEESESTVGASVVRRGSASLAPIISREDKTAGSVIAKGVGFHRRPFVAEMKGVSVY